MHACISYMHGFHVTQLGFQWLHWKEKGHNSDQVDMQPTALWRISHYQSRELAKTTQGTWELMYTWQ